MPAGGAARYKHKQDKPTTDPDIIHVHDTTMPVAVYHLVHVRPKWPAR